MTSPGEDLQFQLGHRARQPTTWLCPSSPRHSGRNCKTTSETRDAQDMFHQTHQTGCREAVPDEAPNHSKFLDCTGQQQNRKGCENDPKKTTHFAWVFLGVAWISFGFCVGVSGRYFLGGIFWAFCRVFLGAARVKLRAAWVFLGVRG